MTRLLISLAALTAILTMTTTAFTNDTISAYTKLDFDTHCTRIDTPPDDEPDLGGYFKCTGYEDYPVWLSTGDIRESVQFGKLNPQMAEAGSWESFSSFNAINTTFEWRLRKGKPFAVIYRHFIDHIDPETGGTTQKSRGQILVIKSVATDKTNGIGCVYGLIDARANKNANALARKVADAMTDPVSHCVSKNPQVFGKTSASFQQMSRSFPDP